MAAARDIESLSRDELLELVKQLIQQNEELRRIVEEQQKRIDELTRRGKRQATPFSKGTRKPNPKPPGRKPGDGTFRNRPAPEPETVTGPPVDVPVEAPSCPSCNGPLEHEHTDDVYVTDIPPMPAPIVTHYRVEVCRCLTCGHRVRGAHAEVAPDQYGATASRVGARVMAVAHWLHYDIGLPQRKVPQVLEGLAGVRVTQSALAQDAIKRARGTAGAVYETLRAKVAHAPVVHTDDTGWKEGGETAFLMTFETPEQTVFQVRRRHRNEEVREVIGDDYEGVLCTDRGASYDARELAGVKQQKCLAHIQRSIAEVLEGKRGRARWFGERLKTLLTGAIAVRKAFLEGGSEHTFHKGRARLKREITEHLRDRGLTDADNQRLLNGIGAHHDRGNLLRFLDDTTIEPTNNAAERALRPAVIARKVSHCTKNANGSTAFEVFTSVTRTLRKAGGSVIEGLVSIFRGTTSPDAAV